MRDVDANRPSVAGRRLGRRLTSSDSRSSDRRAGLGYAAWPRGSRRRSEDAASARSASTRRRPWWSASPRRSRSAPCCSSCRHRPRTGTTAGRRALHRRVGGHHDRPHRGRHRDVLELFGQLVILAADPARRPRHHDLRRAHRPRCSRARLSVRTRLNTANEAEAEGFTDVRGLVRGIVGHLAARSRRSSPLLLFLRFLRIRLRTSAGRLARGVPSVSAFNNAGFALAVRQPRCSSWAIRSSASRIAAGVILGGLGFPVIMQLRKEFRRPLHWSMNTKLVVCRARSCCSCSAPCTSPSSSGTTPAPSGRSTRPRACSRDSSLGADPHRAGSTRSTSRAMHDESWLGTDVLMFIGAGPAGTAGGIKVTTFAVLFFIIVDRAPRRAAAVNIFGKRLSRAVHRQAITVVLVAVAAVMGPDAPADAAHRHRPRPHPVRGGLGVRHRRALDGHHARPARLRRSSCSSRSCSSAALGPLTLGSAIALRERRILYEYPKERPAIG